MQVQEKEKQGMKFVHKGKMPLSELQCPEIVRKSLNKLLRKHPNVPPTAILNILRVNLGHLVMSKKVKLNFAGEIITPGQFSMILLKSGVGKDFIRKDLKNYLFKQHRQWFKEQAEILYQQMVELYEIQQLEDRDRKNKNAEDFEKMQTDNNMKGEKSNVPTTNENPF